MDQLVPSNTDSEVDIESGRSDDTYDGIENSASGNRQTEKMMNRVWSGNLSSDGSDRSTDDSDSSNDVSKLGGIKNDTLPLIRDKASGERQGHSYNGKHKKNAFKALKPPRPPNGPLLSANDQKFVREISELAMRKRARIERIKKLKTMREAKRSSSCYSAFAMTFTIIFFLFVIFQGLFSTSSAALSSDGSPAPAVLAREGLISVQFYNDFARRERDGPGPTSFRRLEKRVSGSDLEDNARNISR